MSYWLKRILVPLVSTVVLVTSSVSVAQVCANPGRDGTVFSNSYFPGTSTSTGLSTATPNQAGIGTVRSADIAGFAASTAAFAAGDLAFIFQVQDADFNTSDNNQYGDGTGDGTSPDSQTATNYNGSGWTDLRQTGKYEFALVQTATTTTLTFRDNLKNTYSTVAATATTPRRRYQVIRVAQNSTLTLAGTQNVLPWNGETGGVIVFDVAGALTLNNATINADGAGFRGGGGEVGGDSNAPTSVAYATLPSSTTRGGAKGEGVAGTPDKVRGPVGANVTVTANSVTLTTPSASGAASNGIATPNIGTDPGYPGGLTRSRGAAGNSGGGATAHNSGGGGGANRGAGGQGAHSFGFYRNPASGAFCVTETATSTPSGSAWFSCDGDRSRFVGGRPGRAFVTADYENPGNRLVLGGGGGAGDGNNQDDNDGVANATGNPADLGAIAQTSGGNGGGVIFIRANTIARQGGTGTLTINSRGQAGLPGGRDGAGGGGAGGTVAIFTTTTSLAGVTVNAQGGNGGQSGSPLRNAETQGSGGGGGGGAILIPVGASGIGTNVSGGQAGQNFQNTTGTTVVSNTLGSGAGGGATGTVQFSNNDVVGPSACIPNLTVAKNSLPTLAGGNTFPAGTTTVQYRVTITNGAGRTTATGINLVDVLPTPFTFAGGNATVAYAGGATKGDGSTGTTIAGAGTTTATFGATGAPSANNFSIPGGGSVALTFTVNVNAATAGTYQNPATANYTDSVAGATASVVYASASSSNDDVTLLAAPTLSKSFNPQYIAPGGTSTLTIQLGNSNASAISLTQQLVDNLPTNVVVASPLTAGTSCTGATLTVVAGGSSIAVSNGTGIPVGGCTVNVLVTSVTAGLYTNTIPAGTVANGLNTTAGAAPAAAAPLVVLEPAKAVRLLTDVDSSGGPSVNDVVQYQIVYNLPASSPAIANFQAYDVLPSQVTYVAVSLAVTPSGGTPAQTGALNAGYLGTNASATAPQILTAPVTLQPGGTITVTINATINSTATSGTPFNNTARASGTGLPAVTNIGTGIITGGLLSDADATPFGTPATALPQPNDTALTGQATQVTPNAPSADLVVTKSQPSPAVVNSGGNVTYTVTVTNNGPNAAQNVVITDTLPAGSTFVGASNGGTQAAGVVTWNSTTTPALSSLANTASQTFTVTITAP